MFISLVAMTPDNDSYLNSMGGSPAPTPPPPQPTPAVIYVTVRRTTTTSPPTTTTTPRPPPPPPPPMPMMPQMHPQPPSQFNPQQGNMPQQGGPMQQVPPGFGGGYGPDPFQSGSEMWGYGAGNDYYGYPQDQTGYYQQPSFDAAYGYQQMDPSFNFYYQ